MKLFMVGIARSMTRMFATPRPISGSNTPGGERQ